MMSQNEKELYNLKLDNIRQNVDNLEANIESYLVHTLDILKNNRRLTKKIKEDLLQNIIDFRKALRNFSKLIGKIKIETRDLGEFLEV